MASSVVHSHKNMKRMQSKKSHSWWWDSHISPKNSKWLADNLEEMDLRVKQMLKLIEEDGESLAKKAEMYYQRRPELMSIVEEIYRMYRALAERYDHLTGELRKHVSWDQQSQSSGVSDISIDSPSTFVTPAPEKLSRRTSGPRAAGFEFFLGSGGSNSDRQKGDESSTLSDSESESDYDSSSIASYSDQLGNVGDQASARKIIDLETELRDVKEKLRTQQEENGDVSLKMAADESSENLLAKIAAYEQQLKFANERIQMSEEEIAMLNFELQRVNSSLSTNDSQVEIESSMDENVKIGETEHECEVDQASGQVLEAEILRANGKIKALAEELRVTKEKLQSSENEIESLRHQLRSGNDSEKVINLQKQLELAYKDVNAWKSKVNSEKKQVSKLQERIMLLKTSLTDRDLEVRELKQAVSDAEEKIFPEKAQIKAEMSKLLEERNSLVEQVRDWEARSRCLEDDIRKYQAERLEMKQQLNFQIHQLKADITERDDVIRNLELEKNALNAEVLSFIEEITSRDAHIGELDQHLQQLHMEHVKLLSGAEEAQKLVEEMKAKTKDLEGEVERQRVAILESAEEKREAIRQLCFSLEHYRDGYQRLRQAVVGHSRVPVMAA